MGLFNFGKNKEEDSTKTASSDDGSGSSDNSNLEDDIYYNNEGWIIDEDNERYIAPGGLRVWFKIPEVEKKELTGLDDCYEHYQEYKLSECNDNEILSLEDYHWIINTFDAKDYNGDNFLDAYINETIKPNYGEWFAPAMYE